MAKKPEDGMATLLKNLEIETGKSVAEWVKLARATGLAKHKELMAHLKAEHGLKHGHANQIALRAVAPEDAPEAGSDAAVDALFAGPKAGLRPIHDQLLTAIRAFGPDVEISPKKANISLRRSKQFGLIQPSSATRLDVGLILKGIPAAGRLEESGSFNAMFTHRVRVSKIEEVDAELIGWLKAAYEKA